MPLFANNLLAAQKNASISAFHDQGINKTPNIAIPYPILISAHTLFTKHCAVKALIFFVGRATKELSIALCEVRRRRETHLVSYFRNRFIGSFQQAVGTSHTCFAYYVVGRNACYRLYFPIQLRPADTHLVTDSLYIQFRVTEIGLYYGAQLALSVLAAHRFQTQSS